MPARKSRRSNTLTFEIPKPVPFYSVVVSGNSYEAVAEKIQNLLDPVKPKDVHISVGLIQPYFSFQPFGIFWRVEIKKYHASEMDSWANNLLQQSKR